jgi:hypothetical protein
MPNISKAQQSAAAYSYRFRNNLPSTGEAYSGTFGPGSPPYATDECPSPWSREAPRFPRDPIHGRYRCVCIRRTEDRR